VLALVACTSASPEHVIDVEMIAGDPDMSLVLEGWRSDCRAWRAAVRPDLVVSVRVNAAGGIYVRSAGGEVGRFFEANTDDGAGIPSAAPTIEREWTFDNVAAAVRAVPYVVEASMPASSDASRLCALFDPDQEMRFQDVSDLHRALSGVGFRYVQLRNVEAIP
jgi:hypothetical protein